MTCAAAAVEVDYRKMARSIDESSGSFFTVRDWMCRGLGLKGAYLTVFAAVWGISSYGEDGAFLGGIPALRGACGVSESTAKRAVRTLRESGLVLQGEWRDAEGRSRLILAPDYDEVASRLGCERRKRPPRPAGSVVAKPVSSRVASVDMKGVRQASGNALSLTHSTTAAAADTPKAQHKAPREGVGIRNSVNLGIRTYGNTETRAGVQNEPHTPSKMTPVYKEELTRGINQRTQQRACDGLGTEESGVRRDGRGRKGLPSPSWDRRRTMSAGSPDSRRPPRPSVEEVRAYAERNSIAVDARAFVAENDGRGWVDSRGRAIRSWRSWLKSWAEAEVAAGTPVSSRPRRGRKPRTVTPEQVAAMARDAEDDASRNTLDDVRNRAREKVERRREERRRNFGPLPSTPADVQRRVCELARAKRFDEARAVMSAWLASRKSGGEADD